MKKILFTDLYDTLIFQTGARVVQIYNSREKEIRIVTNYLNEFLMNGNYVVIVTNPGAHDSFENVFNRTLALINEYILEDLRSRIVFYVQGRCTGIPDDVTPKNINDKLYFFGKNGLSAIHVDKKEEAIIDFLSNIKMPYGLFAIGDSARDIPMLLKLQELGGQSSFIDTRFYTQDVTVDSIIKNELYTEFYFEHKKILDSKTLEEKMEGLTEQEIALYQRRNERNQELYRLLYEGKLDLEKLSKRYHKFIECVNYEMLNDKYFSKGEMFYQNYPFSEDVVKKVVDMPLYPSFEDYYIKVLRK